MVDRINFRNLFSKTAQDKIVLLSTQASNDITVGFFKEIIKVFINNGNHRNSHIIFERRV